MKILSRSFWGTVCIWLGVMLLIILLYDEARDYFPQKLPPHNRTWLPRFISSIFSGSHSPPGKRTPSRPSQPHRAPRQLAKESDQLTSVVHQTKGNYNVWVWGIKPGLKTGNTVTVRIMHAVGGERGGFQIVAYADTTGDGKPDTEIARSDFFTSTEPGLWSSFEFTTSEDRLFVGNTWPPGTNAFIYRGNGPWPLENCPLEDLFYYRIPPGQADTAGPGYTNMKVTFSK